MMHQGTSNRQTQLRPPHMPPSQDEDSIAYCCGGCDRFFSSIFGWLGWKGSTFPYAFIGFAFFLCTLACLGFFSFQFEEREEYLYTPYETNLFAQENSYLAAGFTDTRRVTILLTGQSATEDLFTPRALQAVFDVRQMVMQTSFSLGVTNTSGSIGFTDLCVRGASVGGAAIIAGGKSLNSKAYQCDMHSVTDWWSGSVTTMLSDTALRSTLFTAASSDISQALSGSLTRRDDVVSVVSSSSNSTSLPVQAYQISFDLLHRPTTDATSQDELPRDRQAERWETLLAQRLSSMSYSTFTNTAATQTNGEVFSSSFGGFNIRLITQELRRSTLALQKKHDQDLLVVCFLAVWLALVFIWIRRNYIRSRMGLSIASILSISFALTSGFGAAAGVGLSFHSNMLWIALAILVLGLGDAELFSRSMVPFSSISSSPSPFDLNTLASQAQSRFWWIRAQEYEGVSTSSSASTATDIHGREGYSDEALLSAGAAAVGPFVSVTGLALVCAALLGAYTSIPSFRSFFLTFSLCLIFLWIYHFLFLIPCLALDMRRQRVFRCDIPCCCCPPIEHGRDEKLCARAGEKNFDENDASILGSILGRPILDALFNASISIFMVILFLALLSGGIVGCARVSKNVENIAVSGHLPRNSLTEGANELRDAYQVQQDLFPSSVRQKEVYVYTTKSGTDYFASMTSLDALANAISLNSNTILPSATQFWWPAYIDFLATTAPWSSGTASGLIANGRPLSAAVFESSLAAFLQSDSGARFLLDLLPLGTSTSTNDLGGGLRATRMRLRLRTSLTTNQDILLLGSVRTSVPFTTSSSGLQAYPFSTDFFQLESQDVLVWMIVRSHLLTAGVILFFLLFLLANFWAALLCMIWIAVTIAEVFGILSLVNMPFVASCVHPLLLVPFLATWPVSLVMQAFLKTVGLRRYRARKVLEKLGGVGVDYTAIMILSVVFLAAAHGEDYYAAFLTFSLSSAILLLNSWAVFPITLSYLGPEMSWQSEIVLSNDTAPMFEGSGIDATGHAKKTDSSVPHDPSDPFSHAPEFHPPPTNHAVEMQELVAAHQRAHTGGATGAGAGAAGEEDLMLHPQTRATYSVHDPSNRTGIAQLQNRSTPQKPVPTQKGWM